MKLDEQTLLRCPKKTQGVLHLSNLKVSNVDIIPSVLNAIDLQQLYLDNNYLKSLGDVAKYCWNIKKLSVSVNFLSLSSEFGEFTGLVYLDISANRFTELGDLGHLKDLKYINIEHNIIAFVEKLPDNLQILKAGHNNLSSFSFLTSTRLKQLYLPNNKIKSLTKLVGKCTNLKLIDLSFNLLSLQEYPSFIALMQNQLGNVRWLNFEGNEITRAGDFVLDVLRYCHPDRINGTLVTPFLKRTFRDLKTGNNFDTLLDIIETEYAINIKKDYDHTFKGTSDTQGSSFDDFKQMNKEKLVNFIKKVKSNGRKQESEIKTMYRQMKDSSVVQEEEAKIQRELDAAKKKERELKEMKEEYQKTVLNNRRLDGEIKKLQEEKQTYGKDRHRKSNKQSAEEGESETSEEEEHPQSESKSVSQYESESQSESHPSQSSIHPPPEPQKKTKPKGKKPSNKRLNALHQIINQSSKNIADSQSPHSTLKAQKANNQVANKKSQRQLLRSATSLTDSSPTSENDKDEYEDDSPVFDPRIWKALRRHYAYY